VISELSYEGNGPIPPVTLSDQKTVKAEKFLPGSPANVKFHLITEFKLFDVVPFFDIGWIDLQQAKSKARTLKVTARHPFPQVKATFIHPSHANESSMVFTFDPTQACVIKKLEYFWKSGDRGKDDIRWTAVAEELQSFPGGIILPKKIILESDLPTTYVERTITVGGVEKRYDELSPELRAVVDSRSVNITTTTFTNIKVNSLTDPKEATVIFPDNSIVPIFPFTKDVVRWEIWQGGTVARKFDDRKSFNTFMQEVRREADLAAAQPKYSRLWPIAIGAMISLAFLFILLVIWRVYRK
jgi:hypothetical protein